MDGQITRAWKMVCWAEGSANGMPWTSSAGFPMVKVLCNLLLLFSFSTLSPSSLAISPALFPHEISFSTWVRQINLHHCCAASLNLEKETEGVKQFIILAQELWIHNHRIYSIPSSWTIFQNHQSICPRACVFTAPTVSDILLTQFTTGDHVAVFLKSSHHSERPIVLVSSPMTWQELL